ncbi:MAG: ABC transporter substrate-binding protein [Mucinivorans sp.]
MSVVRLLLPVVFICALCSCGVRSGDKSTSDSLLYKAQYAERFELRQHGDTLLFVVKDPWQGAQNERKEYHIREPLRRIICLSSTHIAFLDALGCVDRIVGVSGRQFIMNPAVANVADVGYDKNLVYELIVSLRADAVFVYDVAGESSAQYQKLESLGVPIVYIADYLEQNPLGRAEWIVAFGALTGQMERAQQIFLQIAQRYNSIKDELSTKVVVRPKVMLNSPYRDVWYLPGDRSYMARLLKDAQVDYLGAGDDSDKSRAISVETAYQMVGQADYWLSPGVAITSLAQLKAENHRFEGARVLQQGMVFHSSKRHTAAGGSDFWESGALRADVVLRDLATIFYSELFPNDSLYYFDRLK